jgi:DNA helicase HerA-like ATPase
MIDLTLRRFCIFGLQGSGKTELAKAILRRAPNHLVWDWHQEYKGFNRYLVKKRYDLERQITLVIQKLVPKVDMFLIDEANRLAPNRSPLIPAIAELNDDSRHAPWRLSLGFLARRPVQLNTDLVELSHYLFIFNLKGKNDIDYLNDLAAGLGDTVATMAPYHYAAVDQYRNYKIMAPVAIR